MNITVYLGANEGNDPSLRKAVRYGNQNFIDEGQNGYKITLTDDMEEKEKVEQLADRIVRLFTEADMERFHAHSYEKAKEYLTEEVVERWKKLLGNKM